MFKKHHTIQNTALRVATGCGKISPIDHLMREETKVLPFHDYLSLLCSQYFATTLKSNNHSKNTVSSLSGFKNMKQKHNFFSRCPYTLLVRCGMDMEWNKSGGFELLPREITPRCHISQHGTLKPLVPITSTVSARFQLCSRQHKG